tara:strand:+ start:456 stop:812 length:357 start_codon:yes stop_codon:yes gene_type:complete
MPKRRKMVERYVSEEAEHCDEAEIEDNGSEDAEIDGIDKDQEQDETQMNKNDCEGEDSSDAGSDDQDEEYESDFIDDDSKEKSKIGVHSEFANDDDYSRSGSQTSEELTMSQELDNLQ